MKIINMLQWKIKRLVKVNGYLSSSMLTEEEKNESDEYRILMSLRAACLHGRREKNYCGVEQSGSSTGS